MKLPVLVVLVLLLIPAAALNSPSWLKPHQERSDSTLPESSRKRQFRVVLSLGNSNTDVSLTKSNRILWKFEVRGKACEWLAEKFLEDHRSSGTSSVAWTFSLLSAVLAPVLLSAYARLRK